MPAFPHRPIAARARRLLPAALFVALCLGQGLGLRPAGAQDAGAPTGDRVSASLAPKVGEMLGAGIPEAVVIEWVDAQPAPSAPPSAEEMIRLQGAGASEELLRALLDHARRGPEGAATPRGTAADEPMQGGTGTEAAAAPAPGAEPGAPLELPSRTGVKPPPLPGADRRVGEPPIEAGEVPVTYRLTYAPQLDTEEGVWDLFVYVDGKPLTYVPRTSPLSASEVLEFRRGLAPGRHVLRIAREQHRRTGEGWEHAARVLPEALVFNVAPGEPARVEVTFRQSPLDILGTGPVDFQFLQGDRVESREDLGPYPEEWPMLCEEIEASVPPGSGPSWTQRGQLRSCTRWDDLWQGVAEGEEVPHRDEVREALAEFDYKPVPREM